VPVSSGARFTQNLKMPPDLLFYCLCGVGELMVMGDREAVGLGVRDNGRQA
jgi:hypothetical protein